MKFDKMVNLILEELGSGSSNGIAFRKANGTDTGCCIGVKHGYTPKLSKELIERIKKMNGSELSGAFAEGADLDPIDPILQAIGIKRAGNWDKVLEVKDKGARDPRYNSVYIFMQSNVESNPNYVGKFKGKTIGEAITNWLKTNKGNIPTTAVNDIAKAGFKDYLNKPFSVDLLKELFQKLEDTVYVPPKFALNPKSFFGTKMEKIEEERNQSLFNCMANGGVAFAGAGHLTELKEQFPNDIELLDAGKSI
jgi:hypothetical protein